MDISLNAPVACSDGAAGHVSALILNPLDDQITHVVVRETGRLAIEREAPVLLVVEATPERITLSCTQAQLAALPPFVAYEYEPTVPKSEVQPPEVPLYRPYLSVEGEENIPVGFENIPRGETVLHRGARVRAVDGQVGRVDELVTGAGNKVTHMLMREGHLWGQKDITIPVSQIDHIDEDTVYLKLTKQEIATLPTIPIRRREPG